MRRARIVPVVLAAVLASAFGVGAQAAADPALFPLEALPVPHFDGAEMVDQDDAFSTTYVGRVTGTPMELMAAQFLRDDAAALGYEAEVRDLPIVGGGPPAITRAVIATKPGLTRPDESIVFIAHFDVLPQSITGTYDNGSGTTMLRHLARELADVSTNRTLVFAWYNGEEEGTLASDAHAQEFKAAGRAVAAVLGFDMVGIAWPVATPSPRTCLCMWHGPEDEAFVPLLRHANFDFLDFPEGEGLVNLVGVNDRNSDEAAWRAAGYPTMRWAGLRRAADYPQYHMPQDTLATMVGVAGGREFLNQGFANTARSAYYTALTVDNAPPVPRALVTGSGAAWTMDASTSTDADGPIATYRWDFDDGTTGQGRRTSHTYSRAGSYDVRLTVTDNLWPAVTRSATFEVGVAAGDVATGPDRGRPMPATGAGPGLAALAALLMLTAVVVARNKPFGSGARET